ncbi:hypothetical protein EJ08DRAFT_651085 [Tothia fuscella]|uniref:Uncharacterized protein n=1 Tax=Tothia fuscella TaxID=1048955 RepID=A0A9P4NN11_9PEZI|nr:hypothetical protein EJ08DRAFT_651085 [Tothia fuscella]
MSEVTGIKRHTLYCRYNTQVMKPASLTAGKGGKGRGSGKIGGGSGKIGSGTAGGAEVSKKRKSPVKVESASANEGEDGGREEDETPKAKKVKGEKAGMKGGEKVAKQVTVKQERGDSMEEDGYDTNEQVMTVIHQEDGFSDVDGQYEWDEDVFGV